LHSTDLCLIFVFGNKLNVDEVAWEEEAVRTAKSSPQAARRLRTSPRSTGAPDGPHAHVASHRVPTI
jgi:hypothetical protein